MKPRLVALLIIALAMQGCGDINFDINRYKQAVRSGFTKIPQARQIEDLLGEADHFISYHGSRSVGQDWNTEVHFGGRYVLTMQVPVRVDRKLSQVLEVLGEPKFWLVEISSVTDNSRGQMMASSRQGWEFTAKEWREVVSGNGDFSAIGINLDLDDPLPRFDDYVEVVRRDRVQVRPTE